MKIKLICPECAAANNGIGNFFIETIRDDGLYTGNCPNSHALFIATQTLRHEMLFDIALNAIIDGYNREAVSSFNASMERFFEFAIEVMSSKHKVNSEVFNSAWKKVASQSERQFGAYVFLYTLNFNELPDLLPGSKTEFRNNVIHKGILPDKKQTLEFGCLVYDVIQKGIQKLRDTCIDDVNKILSQHTAKIAEKMRNQYPRTFQVTQTALNIIEDISSGYKSFKQLLVDYGISDTKQ